MTIGEQNMLPEKDETAKLRDIIYKEILTLTDDELVFALRAINAVAIGDEDAFYQCWQERLVGYDSIDDVPETMRDNEYVLRYFDERTEDNNGKNIIDS